LHFVLALFGGLVGGWLFEQLGITWGGVLGQLGTAIIGAVALLWVIFSFESVASSLQMT
jgi:uncharacterized membrane protein YeaQ/YmgE (transglycosylase-associated protein family)